MKEWTTEWSFTTGSTDIIIKSIKGDQRKMNVPNRIHNSGKTKKAKGTCKGRLKARRQALKALKVKFMA